MSSTYEFEPKGGHVFATITPTDEGLGYAEKRIEIQYGVLTTTKSEEGKDDVVSEAGRFQATVTTVVDGLETAHFVRSAKAQAALESVVKTHCNGTIADYLVAFENADGEEITSEHDYFKQKIVAPKVDAADVWHNAKFEENREALVELRGEAEGLLEQAAEADQNSQAYRVEFAHVLKKAFVLCGESPKALASWAKGADVQSNLPLLSKLGKGVNALREAMSFALISETMLEMLPASITSGKGVGNAKTNGVKALVAASLGSRIPKVSAPNKGMPDSDGLWSIVCAIAEGGYGVQVGEDISIEGLIEGVETAAGQKSAEYMVNFGKEANMYSDDKKVFDLAYGQLLGSSAGEGLFKDAIERMAEVERCEALPDDTEDKAAQIIAAVKKGLDNNLFLKHMWNAISAHWDTVAQEKQVKGLVEATGDEVENVVTKKSETMYQGLTTEAAVAWHFRYMVQRADHAEVMAGLKALYALSAPKPVEEKIAAE